MISDVGWSVTPSSATAYLASEGFEAELRAEIGPDATPVVPGTRLLLAAGPARPTSWAANVWLDPVRIRFASITDAAGALRSLGRDWVQYPTHRANRARLIAERLPRVASDPIAFPPKVAPTAHGSWALIDTNEILAAAHCTSPFPNGEAHFVEDHSGPPSRAYLKLWEAFIVAGTRPRPGARCVDLGSSPGGWTWALEHLGARVVSVDKAPIAERLVKLTRVRYVMASAFALDPTTIGRVDWVFSDVVCYPARSVRLIETWLAAHPRASFVVTIKLQGKTDMTPMRSLLQISGARLVHLHHNRHELTWIRIAEEAE